MLSMSKEGTLKVECAINCCSSVVFDDVVVVGGEGWCWRPGTS